MSTQAELEIRVATPADLPALEAAWPTTGVHASHMVAVERGDASLLVAWNGRVPVGSAMVRWIGPIGERARDAYPDVAEVTHLHVRAEHRGRGVGTALLCAAQDIACRRGHDTIAISVDEDNTDAARLYARLGFDRTGIIDRSEYTWFDDDGTAHDEIEHDELLLRRVR